MVDKPVLVTSFTEFERAFGGLEDVGRRRLELPRLRGPGVLRQRRSPALRLPGLPVVTKDDGAGHQVTDVDANFAKLTAAAVVAARHGHLAGPLARGGGQDASACRSASGAARTGWSARESARGWPRAPRWRSSPTRRRSPVGHRPADEAGPGQRPDRGQRAPGDTLAAAQGRRHHGGRCPPRKALCHITLDVTVGHGHDRADTYTGLELGRRQCTRARCARCCGRAADRPAQPGLARPGPAAAGRQPHPVRHRVRAARTPCSPSTRRPRTSPAAGTAKPSTRCDLAGEKSDPDDAEQGRHRPRRARRDRRHRHRRHAGRGPVQRRSGQPEDRDRQPDRALRANCATGSAIVDPPKDSSISGVRGVPVAVRHEVRGALLPVDGDPRPDRGQRPRRGARDAAAAAVRVRGRDLRPQRHRARRAQGARPTRWCSGSPGSCRTSPSTGSRC